QRARLGVVLGDHDVHRRVLVGARLRTPLGVKPRAPARVVHQGAERGGQGKDEVSGGLPGRKGKNTGRARGVQGAKSAARTPNASVSEGESGNSPAGAADGHVIRFRAVTRAGPRRAAALPSRCAGRAKGGWKSVVRRRLA